MLDLRKKEEEGKETVTSYKLFFSVKALTREMQYCHGALAGASELGHRALVGKTQCT